ncbi:hypothetical protein M409DRAFT_23696 [Zasmidium cellare ATCC 36951]|uniref:2EXR domain-containing protein n=1 Tax=Zasmidium cellare ATCC 36951 TaxID=1080233 RepID=A0A6A6CJT5_ZASCE|nr:uncharacterized protein M409DRAFT_23696 [Zasmidium cellare ATCC 36951]KAF2165969.1 hypothetical protein M409DRAFT_23696 [Zasmidium cellare ATCC 36951]
MAADPGSDLEEEAADVPYLLWTLPQELRDMIYELACDFEVTIFSTTRKSAVTTWNPAADMRLKAKQTNMGLLSACKQLRVEARKVWYKHTLFTFSSPIACATWFKRHVPAQFQSVVKHLRVTSPGAEGRWFSLVKQGGRMPLGRLMAIEIKYRAKETLLSVRAQIREPLLSVLPPDALQVEMFDSKWTPVWTSTPDEVELPRTKMKPARYFFPYYAN